MEDIDDSGYRSSFKILKNKYYDTYFYNEIIEECSYFEYYVKIDGCMDAPACNYDASATEDDGSCVYSGASSTNCTTCSGESDGSGTIIPADDDGDGICNNFDDCKNDSDNDLDSDDVCGDVDNCPTISNSDQANNDGDDNGDLCDSDDDDDGILDDVDTCPFDLNNPKKKYFLNFGIYV